MSAVTPTSELEAVNEMLRCINEMPVNSLDDDQVNADVAIARQTLEAVTKEVLARGWRFNTDTEYPLLPSDGEFTVPTNTIRCVVGRQYGSIVQRDTRLYDLRNHTFTFTLPRILVTLVQFFPFEETPESFRRYCTIRAARQFADRQVGDQLAHAYNAQDEAWALATLQDEEGEVADYNILLGQRERFTSRLDNPRRGY